MNILVCGGAGYIGSHMVRTLLEAGHTPVILDNFSTGHAWAAERAFKGHGAPHIMKGSLLDPSFLHHVFATEPFDAVMHFSAFIEVGESVHAPGKYYENNVSGTLNLLRAMRRAKVDKFVFSSTCAIHGIPESTPIVEGQGKRPINPYGWTKLMAEVMMADFAVAHGLKSVALRYFNAAGAHPDGDLGEAHDPESHLIPNAIKAALGQGQALKVFGDDYPTPDGTCLRDYIHILDLAQAHLLALDFLNQLDKGQEKGQSKGRFEPFNVGTGQATSVLEIIKAVEATGGKKVPYSLAPRREGDSPALYANADKARALLGWEPAYSLEDIVASAWKWHTAQGSAAKD